MTEKHTETPRDHNRLLRRTRVLAYQIAKLGKKIDRLSDRVKKNGIYLLWIGVFGVVSSIFGFGNWVWDTALPKLKLRESIHYVFQLNDANIYAKTLDYRSNKVQYKFHVTVSNTGDAVGGKGRLLASRLGAEGVARIIALSEPQRSIDNLSLSVDYAPTTKTVRLSDLPRELLFCVWQNESRKRIIPILSRIADEYATTTDVKGSQAGKRVGYAPYTAIPLNPDASDPLTLPDACEKAVQSVEGGKRVDCVPFAGPLEPNCRPDEATPSKDVSQTKDDVTTAQESNTPPVDPVLTAKNEMKQRMNGASEWVSCSNGTCYLRELGQSLAAVQRIDLGTTATSFERTIPIVGASVSTIQPGFSSSSATVIPPLFVLPNTPTYIRLDYFDGSQSETRSFKDQSNFAGLQGALLHEATDATRMLLAAYNPNRSSWSFLPLLRTGETVSGYSLDEGGFFDPKPDFSSQIWNGQAIEVTEKIPSRFIRLQITRGDATEPATFKFFVPADLPDAARKTIVMREVDHLIECKRFEPSDFKYQHDTSFAGSMSQLSVDMGRNASGYGFVTEAGIACILPQLSGAPTADASMVLQAIEFRSEPDHVRRTATVARYGDNINLQPHDYMRNYAHILMPVATDELYMTLIFKSGERSREYRLKLPQHS